VGPHKPSTLMDKACFDFGYCTWLPKL
jgi:hypothetical protein